MKLHTYEVSVRWTGGEGEGTRNYTSYRRDHSIVSEGKQPIAGSSQPSFRGDPGRYNPEELLVASLSTCHMLWYLHLCSKHHIIVVDYRDSALGEMEEAADGSGSFSRVLLRPEVTISFGGDSAKARDIHVTAHDMCFIAKSVRFPVECAPHVVVAASTPEPL